MLFRKKEEKRPTYPTALSVWDDEKVKTRCEPRGTIVTPPDCNMVIRGLRLRQDTIGATGPAPRQPLRQHRCRDAPQAHRGLRTAQ
jgi:hypothetical protein